MYFFNGLTLEFGDEFLCMAYDFFGYSSQGACRKALLSIIYVGAERYTYISIISAVLGYALSPTFFIYVAIKGKPNTAGQIFSTILMVELIEGSISVLGQLATDGDIGTAIISLPLSLAVGSVRAIVLSFLFEWNRSDFFKFQFVALACLLVGSVMYFFDFGSVLRNPVVAVSQPETPQPQSQNGDPVSKQYALSAICVVNRSDNQTVRYTIQRYSGRTTNHDITKPYIRIHDTASPTFRNETMPFTIIFRKSGGGEYHKTISAPVFPISESDVPNIEKVLHSTRGVCGEWFPKIYIHGSLGRYYVSK